MNDNDGSIVVNQIVVCGSELEASDRDNGRG